MRFLAKPLGYLLTWIYSLVGSYGLALIILTVLVKVCLYPVYAKSMKSSMKMSQLQPKMQELQQKYGKDKEIYNQKVSELYKEEGASMYGGCLPMIVQMIIIMGLFTLLRNPMSFMNTDTMLFAIHEKFLWIQDLAQPDKWILPVAAGVATFISFSMSSNPQNNTSAATATTPGAAQSMGAMNKSMKWVFPIMILWMARTYPAGLAIYWFGSQLIQIFYNLRFGRWKKAQAAKEEAKKAIKKKKKVQQQQ